MIKEPKLHKETRPFFFFLIGKISSVTAKYEMLGDRATDCKSVARGGDRQDGQIQPGLR